MPERYGPGGLRPPPEFDELVREVPPVKRQNLQAKHGLLTRELEGANERISGLKEFTDFLNRDIGTIPGWDRTLGLGEGLEERIRGLADGRFSPEQVKAQETFLTEALMDTRGGSEAEVDALLVGRLRDFLTAPPPGHRPAWVNRVCGAYGLTGPKSDTPGVPMTREDGTFFRCPKFQGHEGRHHHDPEFGWDFVEWLEVPPDPWAHAGSHAYLDGLHQVSGLVR